MAVEVFVPDIPEFAPLLDGARTVPGCQIGPVRCGYWTITAGQELRFERQALGLGPALWNSALCGGFRGHIAEYSRDVLRIVSED